MKSCQEGVLFGGTFIFSGKYLLCTGLRSVLSEYFPEKTQPSEKEKLTRTTRKEHRDKKRKPRNTPEEKKRTPKLQAKAKGPSQKNHEPSIAMGDDPAILKLDR